MSATTPSHTRRDRSRAPLLRARHPHPPANGLLLSIHLEELSGHGSRGRGGVGSSLNVPDLSTLVVSQTWENEPQASATGVRPHQDQPSFRSLPPSPLRAMMKGCVSLRTLAIFFIFLSGRAFRRRRRRRNGNGERRELAEARRTGFSNCRRCANPACLLQVPRE